MAMDWKAFAIAVLAVIAALLVWELIGAGVNSALNIQGQ